MELDEFVWGSLFVKNRTLIGTAYKFLIHYAKTEPFTRRNGTDAYVDVYNVYAFVK